MDQAGTPYTRTPAGRDPCGPRVCYLSPGGGVPFWAGDELGRGAFACSLSHFGLGGGFLPPGSLGRYPRVSSGIRIFRAVAICFSLCLRRTPQTQCRLP